MKKLTAVILSFSFALFSFAAPQKVIFDTDIGNDIDDVLALLILFHQVDKRAAEIELISINKDNPFAPVFTNIVSDFYGHRDIPIAMVKGGGATKEEGRYSGAVAKMTDENGMYKYSRRLDLSSNVPDAVKEARKVLANAKDGEIAYISVGFSTNLANLLKSQPDDISHLSGADLFAKKVKCVSIMAGNFSKESISNPAKAKPEYNVLKDIKSFSDFLKLCRVPVIFSGFEVGESIRYPHSEIDKMGSGNPVENAYNLYVRGKRHDRHCWDLTSVMWVFEPALFDLSAKGTVTVDERGVTHFSESDTGKHQYLILGKSSHNLMRKMVESVSKAKISN